jgi:hypothetical protein
MSVYVNNHILAVGARIKGIFDPTTGEEVTIQITQSGTVQSFGGQHPQAVDTFTARVVEGFEPGREVRGYTNVAVYDGEDNCISAVLMEHPTTDWLVRDIRLAHQALASGDEGLAQAVRVMEHALKLRGQLEVEGMGTNWLRQVLQHPFGGCSMGQLRPNLHYEKGCAGKYYRRSRWYGRTPVFHNGRLVPYNSGLSSSRFCRTFKVEGATVVRLSAGPVGPGWRAHPPVYVMSEDATLGEVRAFLKAARAAEEA